MQDLAYIPKGYFDTYNKKTGSKANTCFQNLKKRKPSADDFSHYITASAVASAQIEGSTLDLNSFFFTRENFQNNKEVIEIENLIEAYQFARSHEFSADGLLECHKILSHSFSNISKSQKGKYRKTQVGIRGFYGLVYVASEPKSVKKETEKLFEDVEALLQEKLSFNQTLYYAAFIHFLFAKIHPFADGNGRAARLLEKWFLAEKLGKTAWSIPAEKYYWDNRAAYYDKLDTGLDYLITLENLQKAVPFLQMLPKAVCYRPKY